MSEIVLRHPDAPHAVVLWVSASVFEMTAAGECGQKFSSAQPFPIRVDAPDRAAAVAKLEEIVSEMKKKWG